MPVVPLPAARHEGPARQHRNGLAEAPRHPADGAEHVRGDSRYVLAAAGACLGAFSAVADDATDAVLLVLLVVFAGVQLSSRSTSSRASCSGPTCGGLRWPTPLDTRAWRCSHRSSSRRRSPS